MAPSDLERGLADDGKRSGLSKSALGVASGGPKATIPIRFIFFITEGEVRRGRNHEISRRAGGLADFFGGPLAHFLAVFVLLGLFWLLLGALWRSLMPI